MPQQFLVPQFIDVETKIFGPVTTRQFIIMMISGMVDFVMYKLFLFNTFVVLAILNTIVFGVVAFLRINGAPFHYFFLNMVQTLKRPRLRVWKKSQLKAIPKEKEVGRAEVATLVVRKQAPQTSRLSALALMVDTGGAYKSGEVESRDLTVNSK